MQEDIKKEEEKKKYQTPEFDPFNLPVSDVARQDKLPSIKQSEIYNLPGYVSDKLGKNFKPQYGVNEMFDLYDKTLKAENDAKADAQSYGGLFLKGIGNILTTAGKEIVKIPGYIGGLAMAASDEYTIGEAMDNAWLNSVDSFVDDNIKEGLLKVYTPSSVSGGSLWDKATSASWWATTGADGIGNVVGFMGGGALFKSIGLGTKLFGKASKLGRNVDDASQVLFSATIESSMEAHESFKGTLAQLQPKIDSGELTVEEARNIAGEQSAKVFGVNMLLLGVSNTFDQKWLFGGFRNESKEAIKAAKKALDGTKESAVKFYQKIPSAVSTIGKGFVKEGFYEEGSQFATSKYFENRATGKEENSNWFTGIIGTYLDSMDDVEFQESVFLGGVLGSPMSMYGKAQENKNMREYIYGSPATTPSTIQRFFGKREQSAKKGLVTLLQENYATAYVDMNNIWKTDENGKQILDAKGKPQVDTAKRAAILETIAKKDTINSQLVAALEKGDTITHKLLTDITKLNFMTPYLDIEGGQEIFKAHLQKVAEAEVRQAKALENTDLNLETVKSEMMQQFNEFKTMHDNFNNPKLKAIKLSEKTKLANPMFHKILLGNIMTNSIFQKNLEKAIKDIDADIATHESETSAESKVFAEILKQEKTNLEKTYKQVQQKAASLLTQKGQEEALSKFKEDNEKAKKDLEEAENETEINTESKKINNPNHASIYEQITKLSTVNDKQVKSNGAVKFEYTTKDGKLFRMTAEVIGVEDGKLVLKDIKDPKSVPFTLEVDNTFNGNTISSEIEIAFTGEENAAIKTNTNTGENTPEEHNKSQEELISTAKVDKDLDVNVGSSEPKPRFNLETLSMFLRTIGNQEDYEGSGMTSFSNMYSLIEEIATNQNIKDFYFKVHTKNNTSEKDPLILKLKKEGATFEEGWILLVAYKKGSDVPYQLNGVEGNIAVTWVPDPMLGYLKNQSKKLGNYSWGELAEIPDAQQRNNSINTAFLTGAQIFEESVRKPLLENTEVITIPFGNITRGKIVGSEENNLVDSITGTVEGLSSIELSTVKTGTYKGLVSIVHRGINIPLLRNNIDSKTASEIIDLMKLMLDDTTSLADKKDIKKYLDSIVYISQERGNHKYSLSILSSKRKIVGFQIAIENEKGKISYATYKAETFKNKGAVNKLQSFLETKFFNINEKSVKGDFIVRTVKKGKLESKAFSKSKGGYLGYMHSKNAYSVKLKPLSENQFLNRAITLPIEPKLQGQPKTTVAEVTTPSTTQFVLTERGIKQAENLVEIGQHETIEEATEFLLKQGKKAFVEQLQIPVEQQEPQVPLPKTEQDNNDFAPGEEPTVDAKTNIERRRQEELEALPFDEEAKQKLEYAKTKGQERYLRELKLQASKIESRVDTSTGKSVLIPSGNDIMEKHNAEDVLNNPNSNIESRIMAIQKLAEISKPYNEARKSDILKSIAKIKSGDILSVGDLEIKKIYDAEIGALKGKPSVDIAKQEEYDKIDKLFNNGNQGTYQSPKTPENKKYSDYSSKGWKIHIQFGLKDANRVAKFLLDNNLYFKVQTDAATYVNAITNGGATIYVGGSDNTLDVINLLKLNLSDTLTNNKNSNTVDLLDGGKPIYSGSGSDIAISDGIAIRFDVQKSKFGTLTGNKKYESYGFASYLGNYSGISFLAKDTKKIRSLENVLETNSSQEEKIKALDELGELHAESLAELEKDFGKDFVGIEKIINARKSKSATTASVPITITSQVRQQLYDLGYSKQDVDSMKPEEGQTIISNQTTKPKVQITISAEEIKAWRESKEELGHDVSDLTDDQVREKINKSGKNKIYREEQSTLSPEVLAWFKKKFPGFTPEFIENGLIDGVALGRVLPSMRLILSPLAGDRDIYHEAFHIVFNFFLNKTDRTRLYNETKNRLGNKIVTVQSGETFVDKKGSELTNDEIEEFLAEENADFLANPSTYKFNKGEEVKQGFFKRLWNAIKSFFGVKSIEEYFEFINSETFDKSYATANAEMLNPVNKLAEFSEHEKLGMLNHFNARFFENLTGDLDGNFSPKNLFDLTTKKILAAQKITVISFSKSQRKADQIVAGNVEEIQKLHFEFLKQYGFSKLEEALIQENDRIGKNSTQFVESATVNVLDNIPSAIQLLFASIPQKYKNVNGEEIAFEDTNGFYKNIDVSATANTLYREFANLPTQQLMWDKLYKLSKGAPHFNKLAEWIGLVEENGTFMPDYNATQETGNLRRLFYSEFAKNRNNVLEGVTDKVNKYSSISSTQYTLENKLMSMWKNNLGNSYKKNKFFFYKNGLYRLNVSTKLKLPISISRNEDSTREIITGLYNSSILQNPKEKVNYEKTKQKLLKELETKSDSVYLYELININDFNKVFPTVESTKEYMNIFGIELDPAVDLNLIHKFIKWSSNEIANKTKLGKKLILEDFYDQNSNKIGKELRELANDQLAYQGGNNLNNMYTTSNGSSEYAITLNTTYSKNIDKTRYKLENEFTPWSITNKGGNLTTVYSSWQEAADDLRMTVMRSIKQDFGQSKDIASATEGDIFQMHFNQMFLGVSAMIPAAARGMDYGVKVMKNFTKNNLISHSDMVMELSKHLKVEIITALAYKNEPQFSRLKSSKYAKSLRIFRKHLPMLNKLISNYEFKEGEEADYITIAEQLIDENSSYVTKGLTTLVVELQDDTMQLIEKTRLFESFDGVNYINNGFNMEKQKSFFNTDQTLAKEEVEYLASNFAFLYFVNGIETLKYGIGEISTYAKEKESGEITSDTFKRATTAAGTTTTPANEDVDISDYNKYYNRADGYSHSKNMKFITFKDVFEDSNLLPMFKAMGFENAYSKIKKTDAHGITFLDGMRAFRLRNKSWNDKAEMTYQYTMQNYLLGRVAESKELLDVLGTSKEALLDRFKDHLPKEGWKGVPHFKGKPIDITEMEPITPEKPLGVGKYKNSSITPSGATAVIKTAIFPVFPNNLINTPLEKWMLTAMKEGLDFMFPESALKGDTIGNEKGELPELFTDGNINTIDTLLENNFIPSLFDWSDFGSQLEIDPSGKTKVGESTQKVSEQSLDTLELGEEIFEGAKTLIDESSNLRNAKSEILYKNALTYFGIKELEDGTYKLEDKEKLIKALKSEFNRKTYDENALNGIKKVLDSDLKIMDTLTIVNNIQYVITSMIDSKMGKHEVKGDMLVQSSQVLSETLNAYVGLDSEGKETQELSKIVKVKPAETILTLPKDLINYVDTYFEGKTFEEKLTRFNAVLYKPEYDSAFTFTLNRIPNKHITNIEVFRVKKFLPPWEGNTIIIPKEIMVKSGSDFDVDKLFTYFNNLNINTKTGKITKIKPGATVEERYIEYIKDRFFTETESNLTTLEKKEKLSTNKNELQKLMTFLKKTATYKDMTFEELLSVELENKSVQFSAIAEENKFMSYEEFSKLPTLEQYSIKAIDNRLSEITAEFVLNPKNLEAFYRPDDNSSLDKAIKKRLTDKKTLIKEDAPYHKQLTYSFGLGYKASQFRAQETLGIAANATTMHSKMQISPVAFNQDIIYIPYKGVSYKMGIIKDAEGKNKISIVLGDKITGTVDAEKQLFPLIVQGGLTTATIGVSVILLETGVKIDDILALVNHDMVKEYLAQRHINESKFLQASFIDKKKNTIINELVGTTSEYIENNFLHSLFTKMLDNPSEENTKNFQDRLETFKDVDFEISEDMLVSKPHMALEYYLYMEQVSKVHADLSQVAKPETKKSMSLDSIVEEEYRINEIKKTNVYDNETIDNLFENTFLKGFRKNKIRGLNMFKEFFMELNGDLGNNIEIMLTPFNKKGLETKMAIKRKLINRTITYIIQKQLVNEKTLAGVVDRLFFSENSLVERILRKKNDDPLFANNPFIANILEVSEKFDRRNNYKLPLDHLEAIASKLDSMSSNSVIRSYHELMESKDSEIKQIAKDIIAMGLIQHGSISSKTRYIDFVPVEYTQPVIHTILNEFYKTGKKLTEEDRIQILQNAWYDAELVPRENKAKPQFSISEQINTLKISAKNKNFKFNLIAVKTKMTGYNFDKAYENQKVEFEDVRLFLKDELNSNETSAIYKEIPKKGIRGVITEVSIYHSDPSKISSNNTNDRTKDGYRFNRTKGKLSKPKREKADPQSELDRQLNFSKLIEENDDALYSYQEFGSSIYEEDNYFYNEMQSSTRMTQEEAEQRQFEGFKEFKQAEEVAIAEEIQKELKKAEPAKVIPTESTEEQSDAIKELLSLSDEELIMDLFNNYLEAVKSSFPSAISSRGGIVLKKLKVLFDEYSKEEVLTRIIKCHS
jgi:hypothetical protein